MVASIFTPIQGGSATVYANLCRFAPPGKMVALATRRHYRMVPRFLAGRPMTLAWTFLSTGSIFSVPNGAAAANKLVSAWRFLIIDIPLRLKVVSMVGN
jgi:hypothetical protein